MGVRTFDPKKVQVIVGGVEGSGFADGTFVLFEFEEDLFTKVTGADGETSRSKSNNRSGTLTLTLKQDSPFNDALSGFHAADILNNSGVVPIYIKDSLGTTTLFGADGWVRKFANVEYAKEITNREWMIDIANVDAFVGGNEVS